MANPEKDDRFRTDRRFKVPKRHGKVKVDSRFSSDAFEAKKSGVDRYGRRLKDLGLEKKSDFDRFYEGKSGDSGSEDSGSEDSGSEVSVAALKKDGNRSESGKNYENSISKTAKIDRARGDGGSESESESESDSDSDSESEPDSESESELENAEEEELVIEEEAPEEGEPSKRLALVNMDWDHITSADLMATFSSFAKGIVSVTIYTSEYGKERMAKEDQEGPSREIFGKKEQKLSKKELKKAQKEEENKEEEDDSDSEIELGTKFDMQLNKEKVIKKLYSEDDGADYDSKNLRKYQLQRLRYYYAVIVCDSVETAQRIYANCDGLEFEATANFFDLRYIPDDVDFDDSERKDFADKVPSNYKPHSDFQTSALQHSKVKLTWDETPAERQEFATKAFSQKDLDEMDFKAYLASDSESEQEVANKYRSLLGQEKEAESDVDMEITFNNALEGEKEKEVIEETTIEQYKRKAKERKQKRKEIRAERLKEKESIKKETETKQGSSRELELLVDKDENHFDLKQIVKAEKAKKQKKKKGKKLDDEYLQDDFQVDLQDERFKQFFENDEYAIDPNEPGFKKTETMKRIMEERSKRREGQVEEGDIKRRKVDAFSIAEKIKERENSGVTGEKKEKKKKKEKGEKRDKKERKLKKKESI